MTAPSAALHRSRPTAGVRPGRPDRYADGLPGALREALLAAMLALDHGGHQPS